MKAKARMFRGIQAGIGEKCGPERLIHDLHKYVTDEETNNEEDRNCPAVLTIDF